MKKEKKYLTIEMEALKIGVTKTTKKRVWLDTRVIVKYNDGSTTINHFDTGKEANIFSDEIMRKYPLVS